MSGGARVLLDGATATALEARGFPPPPERWLRERPEAVAALHGEYRAAGAQVVLTATFNAARLGAVDDPAGICAAAVRLARAAAPGARVAGALGPGCDPALVRACARAFAEAGADLFWAETQTSLDEALALLDAAREVGLGAVVTAAAERPRDEWLLRLAGAGAAAVGANCLPFAGPELAELAARLAPRLGVPLVVKPAARTPPDTWAPHVAASTHAGAAWVGGCCGTTPEHLRALARLLGPP